MATIKTTRIIASMPDSRNHVIGRYIKYYTFTTFIDNTGISHYFLNEKEVSKEEGNKVFLEIKRVGKDIERDDTSEELTYQEIIDKLMKGYDQYVNYIDDYKQYSAACEANDRIMKKVNAIKKLMEAEEG